MGIIPPQVDPLSLITVPRFLQVVAEWGADRAAISRTLPPKCLVHKQDELS